MVVNGYVVYLKTPVNNHEAKISLNDETITVFNNSLTEGNLINVLLLLSFCREYLMDESRWKLQSTAKVPQKIEQEVNANFRTLSID